MKVQTKKTRWENLKQGRIGSKQGRIGSMVARRLL
jgi:hypothetical protein